MYSSGKEVIQRRRLIPSRSSSLIGIQIHDLDYSTSVSKREQQCEISGIIQTQYLSTMLKAYDLNKNKYHNPIDLIEKLRFLQKKVKKQKYSRQLWNSHQELNQQHQQNWSGDVPEQTKQTMKAKNKQQTQIIKTKILQYLDLYHSTKIYNSKSSNSMQLVHQFITKLKQINHKQIKNGLRNRENQITVNFQQQYKDIKIENQQLQQTIRQLRSKIMSLESKKDHNDLNQFQNNYFKSSESLNVDKFDKHGTTKTSYTLSHIKGHSQGSLTPNQYQRPMQFKQYTETVIDANLENSSQCSSMQNPEINKGHQIILLQSKISGLDRKISAQEKQHSQKIYAIANQWKQYLLTTVDTYQSTILQLKTSLGNQQNQVKLYQKQLNKANSCKYISNKK